MSSTPACSRLLAITSRRGFDDTPRPIPWWPRWPCSCCVRDMKNADWENVDIALYTLSLYFRVLVLHWESSAETYAEVDAEINAANVTWERVFADIRHLEDLAKKEGVTVDGLEDKLVRKLSDMRPMEHHRAWEMGVRLEAPHTHDEDAEEDGEAPGTQQPIDGDAADEQPDVGQQEKKKSKKKKKAAPPRRAPETAQRSPRILQGVGSPCWDVGSRLV
ncbi:hypothetical protein QBC46DRAFT_453157 [Diplogelasinospora grovesii]|uniref:Uncharacterized protein n=1 Tax=Diplogelasinospora grovesii TaxID=303347 RepID=A0AAN6S0F2_9PEZI|nr:hypothetical protein QBC46DRAFT_453157 [Diplogelasinospora grovesii]